MMRLSYALNSTIASFVRIRTDFRLARRSKRRNDEPKRAHRPPRGHALPRAEFLCAGLLLPIIFLSCSHTSASSTSSIVSACVRIRTEFRLAKRLKERKNT
jgi:hypothetical protein